MTSRTDVLRSTEGNISDAGITSGSLFQADGTTAISNGDYITYAQGQAGLTFTPPADTNLAGSFGGCVLACISRASRRNMDMSVALVLPLSAKSVFAADVLELPSLPSSA